MSRAMLAGMVAAGASAMVRNVSTRLDTLEVAGRTMPVTYDEGRFGDSYVCNPHSAYVLYAGEELRLLDPGWWAPAARAALFGVDLLVRQADLTKIVHLANWMMSTNLHDGWAGEGVAAARATLASRHPDHVIAIRSVDEWASPSLMTALRQDGWILVPSRQIWVVDDLKRQWLPKHNYANDRRLVARTGLKLEDVARMTTMDASRIADLYAMLYIDRYSVLNPSLSPAFVELSARTGMIRYRVARNPDGVIQAVAGTWTRAGVSTPPVVGYDTGRPRTEGLYRIACWLFMEQALDAGARLHGSAGAAHFKRQRGATGVIEWNAYYARHLSIKRQRAIAALGALLERFVPVMRAKGW